MSNGWSLLVVAGLLLVQQIHVSSAYTMEETCRFINSGFIADPDDCQSYGYCQGLTLVAKQKCPDNTYYNADLGVCQYTPKCRLNAENMCQGVTGPSYMADPNNCTQYVLCQNGVSTTLSCPKYQIYDPTTNSCNWASQLSGSCSSKSPCRLVQDNVFAADPETCGHYFACQKGSGVSKACETPYFFSPVSNYCQTEKYCASTDDGTAGDTPTNDQPPTPPADKCTAANTFISDETTCYGYFKCTGVGVVGDWYKCPSKTHFDPVSSMCVTPYTYACPYDRCGNMDAAFMGARNNDCKNYLNCANNAYMFKNTDINYVGTSCKVGFFDEYSQMCVATSPSSNPNYKLCAAPSPPSGS